MHELLLHKTASCEHLNHKILSGTNNGPLTPTTAICISEKF